MARLLLYVVDLSLVTNGRTRSSRIRDRREVTGDETSIAARLARMTPDEQSAWAAEIAAKARRLLDAPTIDHEDDKRGLIHGQSAKRR